MGNEAERFLNVITVIATDGSSLVDFGVIGTLLRMHGKDSIAGVARSEEDFRSCKSTLSHFDLGRRKARPRWLGLGCFGYDFKPHSPIIQ